MERLLDWFIGKVVPFIIGAAIGVIIAEVLMIIVVGLSRVIELMI